MSAALLALAIPALYLVVVSAPLAWFDLRERRLPNKLTLPGVVLSLLGVIAYGLLGEPIKALASLGVCAALFVLGVALTFKGWLGMGDVKLFVALALPVGAISLWSVAFILGIALLFWLIVSLATILGKLRLHSIPLGPAILGANLVCVGGILLTLTS